MVCVAPLCNCRAGGKPSDKQGGSMSPRNRLQLSLILSSEDRVLRQGLERGTSYLHCIDHKSQGIKPLTSHVRSASLQSQSQSQWSHESATTTAATTSSISMATHSTYWSSTTTTATTRWRTGSRRTGWWCRGSTPAAAAIHSWTGHGSASSSSSCAISSSGICESSSSCCGCR